MARASQEVACNCDMQKLDCDSAVQARVVSLPRARSSYGPMRSPAATDICGPPIVTHAPSASEKEAGRRPTLREDHHGGTPDGEFLRRGFQDIHLAGVPAGL